MAKKKKKHNPGASEVQLAPANEAHRLSMIPFGMDVKAQCGCGEFLVVAGHQEAIMWHNGHLELVALRTHQQPRQPTPGAIRGVEADAKEQIIWKDPPPAAFTQRRTRIGSWDHIAEVLASRPNEWALVKEYNQLNSARSMARSIMEGTHVAFKEGTWEAVVEPIGTKGGGRLYVRQVIRSNDVININEISGRSG